MPMEDFYLSEEKERSEWGQERGMTKREKGGELWLGCYIKREEYIQQFKKMQQPCELM